ncbi:MAG: hypothetical protein R8K21_01685 [Mariprofundales bacterium]
MRFPALHREDDSGMQEGFWPSFTDIMTVIVMIFLMAMLALLLRNMDLIERLQQSLLAQQEATSRSDVANAQLEKTDVALIIAKKKQQSLQQSLLDMQNQLATAMQQQVQTTSLLQQKNQHVQKLQQQIQQQQYNLQQANQKLQHLAQLQDAYTQQNTNLYAVQSHYDNLSNQYELLKSQQQQQQQAYKLQVANIQQQLFGQNNREVILRDAYSQLARKYSDLLRPSRSPLGKYVLQVRYHLANNGQEVFSINTDEQANAKNVNRAQLDAYLLQAKQRYGKSLYVKVIIPDNSGLSFTEAWRFTHDLLSKYDYYNQK